MRERYVKLPKSITRSLNEVGCLIIKKLKKTFEMQRLKKERELVKPIYFILNENREVFDNHWNSRSEAYEKLKEEEIGDVLEYTKQKLIELSNYLNTIKTEKRIKSFYREHVDHLMKYHKSSFNMSYHMQYMFFYSELLLGSERYLIILKRINDNC